LIVCVAHRYLGVAYKPPSSDNAAFIDHLSTTLDLALNKYLNHRYLI
jgi:hypothetical protein